MPWKGVSFFELERKSMETEIRTWSEFPNNEKTITKQIIGSEDSMNPKELECESHKDESNKKINKYCLGS